MVALPARDLDGFMKRQSGGGFVFLVFGPDQGLIDEKISAISRACVADVGDPFQLVRLDGDTVAGDPGLLADEWNSMGLFHARRAIRVDLGARDILESVRACVEAPNPDCALMIKAGALKRDHALRQFCERQKMALAIECFADSEADIRSVVLKTMGDAGVSIDPKAVDTLVDILGLDRAMTRSELEKLALYADETNSIGVADVDMVVADAAPKAGEPAIAAALSGDIADATLGASRMMAGANASGIAGAALRICLLGHRAVAERDAGNAGAAERFARSTGALRHDFARLVAAKNTGMMLDFIETMNAAVDRGRREPALDDTVTMRGLWTIARRAKARR